MMEKKRKQVKKVGEAAYLWDSNSCVCRQWAQAAQYQHTVLIYASLHFQLWQCSAKNMIYKAEAG